MQIAYQHANDSVPTPSSKNPTVPAELDELVLWATARDPEERPRDARELLDQLREIEPGIRASHLPLTDAGHDGAPRRLGDDRRQRRPRRTCSGGARSSPPPLTRHPMPTTLRRSRRAPPAAARRGYWLFALVLLLTGLAAGTGWYFGAGPGSFTTVPDDVDAHPRGGDGGARRRRVRRRAVVGAPIPWCRRARSPTPTPPGGSQAQRGSTVTLYVSEGPQILDVPAVIGIPEAEAREALGRRSRSPRPRHSSSHPMSRPARWSPRSTPTAPRSAPTYPERGAITLVVSVGPVPPVEGLAGRRCRGEAHRRRPRGRLQRSGVPRRGSDRRGRHRRLDQRSDASRRHRGADALEGTRPRRGSERRHRADRRPGARRSSRSSASPWLTNVPAVPRRRGHRRVQSPAAGEMVKRGSRSPSTSS